MAELESGRSVIPNGALIKARRIELGWTQARFAEESGVGERTIQKAEKGEKIDIPILTLIATCLSVPFSKLYRVDAHAQAMLAVKEPSSVLMHEESDGSVTVTINIAMTIPSGTPADSPQLQALRSFIQNILPGNRGVTLSGIGTATAIAISLSAADARAFDAPAITAKLKQAAGSWSIADRIQRWILTGSCDRELMEEMITSEYRLEKLTRGKGTFLITADVSKKTPDGLFSDYCRDAKCITGVHRTAFLQFLDAILPDKQGLVIVEESGPRAGESGSVSISVSVPMTTANEMMLCLCGLALERSDAGLMLSYVKYVGHDYNPNIEYYIWPYSGTHPALGLSGIGGEIYKTWANKDKPMQRIHGTDAELNRLLGDLVMHHGYWMRQSTLLPSDMIDGREFSRLLGHAYGKRNQYAGHDFDWVLRMIGLDDSGGHSAASDALKPITQAVLEAISQRDRQSLKSG